MKKARLALFVGIICISIFPILVKLALTLGLISAFYRMLFSFLLLLPYVIFKKQLELPSFRIVLLAALCGVIFGSDVAVWNIAIQESTATQASLLTNLSPVWVGFLSLFFLKDKPKSNFWIGTIVAVFGMIMLVGFSIFKNLDFDLAFNFAILSGVFYAIYMLLSKHVLKYMKVASFMLISLASSSLYLGIINFALNEPFSGFSNEGWLVLLTQAVVCQLLAWSLISYATQHMRATRVSVSLLGQGVLSSVLAWLLLDETISIQMIIGGFFLLWGIRITFYDKQLLSKIIKTKNTKALSLTKK